MRVSDLKKAIARLPDEATINAVEDCSTCDEFSIQCVTYNPVLKVVLLANDASEVSHVEQVLYDEEQT